MGKKIVGRKLCDTNDVFRFVYLLWTAVAKRVVTCFARYVERRYGKEFAARAACVSLQILPCVVVLESLIAVQSGPTVSVKNTC